MREKNSFTINYSLFDLKNLFEINLYLKRMLGVYMYYTESFSQIPEFSLIHFRTETTRE